MYMMFLAKTRVCLFRLLMTFGSRPMMRRCWPLWIDYGGAGYIARSFVSVLAKSRRNDIWYKSRREGHEFLLVAVCAS